jgi:hypothetical protein
MSKKGA